MKKNRITKNEFCKWMEKLRDAWDDICVVEKHGLMFSEDGNILNYIDHTAGMLIQLTGDDLNYPLIYDYCWNNDFGRSAAVEVWTSDKDGHEKHISAETPEELYDMILEVMELEEYDGD